MSEVAFKSDSKDDVTVLTRRRLMLLKSQNIQLKRQMDIYKTELESREAFVYDVSGNAKLIKEQLKKSMKPQESNPGLLECVKMLDALHRHSSRHIKSRLDSNEQFKPANFYFVSDFISTGKMVPPNHRLANLDEVSNGTVGHLNLKHVARLETDLFDLYSDIVRLHECLETAIEPNVSSLIKVFVTFCLFRTLF